MSNVIQKNINVAKKQRQPWIDIAKGILILIVLLGHVQYFAHDFAGTDDFKFVEHTHILFITWYMPAFFVITGYCTNFEIKFWDFLIKNLKSLILPSILIGVFLSSWITLFFSSQGLSYQNFLKQNYWSVLITCGPWFLTALFVAKIVMYCILKYVKCNNIWKFLLLMLLMLIGCSLYNKKVVLNLWYFEHALVLLPFLFVGVMLRNHKPRKHEDVMFLLLGGAFLGVAIMMKYFEIGLACPYIVGILGVFWGNFWLCLLMGVSGSLALFVICQKIGKCRWLEYLGKHTLTIYLLQESIMVLLIKSYVYWQVTIPSVISVVILILSTAFICAWIDVFIDRHLCFLKGKF
jgi:fucose 4-O-acetylase-like acetyltransferase